jgi:hypothetical protein
MAPASPGKPVIAYEDYTNKDPSRRDQRRLERAVTTVDGPATRSGTPHRTDRGPHTSLRGHPKGPPVGGRYNNIWINGTIASTGTSASSSVRSTGRPECVYLIRKSSGSARPAPDISDSVPCEPPDAGLRPCRLDDPTTTVHGGAKRGPPDRTTSAVRNLYPGGRRWRVRVCMDGGDGRTALGSGACCVPGLAGRRPRRS